MSGDVLSSLPSEELDASGLRFGVVVSDFNQAITSQLLSGALETLARHGVAESDLRVLHVPGAFELPQATQGLLSAEALDALVALGCVIRGETAHFDYVAGEAARGLMQVSLSTGVPVALGVLAVENRDQAEARAGGRLGNRGAEAAEAALRMALLFRQLGVGGTR